MQVQRTPYVTVVNIYIFLLLLTAIKGIWTQVKAFLYTALSKTQRQNDLILYKVKKTDLSL
jgi:hypothetical protein